MNKTAGQTEKERIHKKKIANQDIVRDIQKRQKIIYYRLLKKRLKKFRNTLKKKFQKLMKVVDLLLHKYLTL